MKIVINYDFFNAILDAREGLTPMKVVRNNKKLIAIISSCWFLFDYFIIRNIPRSLFVMLFQDLGIFFIEHCIYNDNDIYKKESIRRLKKLVLELKNQNILTDYDLLLDSEIYDKKYKICFNKEKLLEIMELKYILVPTYDFNGNIKNTSILQEHALGTDEYVLSLGKKEKQKQIKFLYSDV